MTAIDSELLSRVVTNYDSINGIIYVHNTWSGNNMYYVPTPNWSGYHNNDINQLSTTFFHKWQNYT